MLRIFTHNVGSQGLINLRTAITESVENLNTFMRRNHRGISPRSSRAVLASELGTSPCFTNGNRVILCWGSSSALPIHPTNLYLNTPDAIGLATNKKTFFETIEDYNEELDHPDMVNIPEWTELRDLAEVWAEEGVPVYCRTQLQGHSGSGIVVARNESEIVDAPLYTKGVTGARREYRVHVFGDEILFSQVKRRRTGVETNEEVRNLDGGWVFGVSNVDISLEVKRNAIQAIKALGLTFGAVDILAKGFSGQETEVFVLEVNTAPGQQGETTISNYGVAIIKEMLRFYVAKVNETLTPVYIKGLDISELLTYLNYSREEIEVFIRSLPVISVATDQSEGVTEEVVLQPIFDLWGRILSSTPETINAPNTWNVSTTDQPLVRDGLESLERPTSVFETINTINTIEPIETPIIRTSALTESQIDNYYAIGTIAGQIKVGMVVPSRGLFYMIGVDAPVLLTDITITARIEL